MCWWEKITRDWFWNYTFKDYLHKKIAAYPFFVFDKQQRAICVYLDHPDYSDFFDNLDTDMQL